LNQQDVQKILTQLRDFSTPELCDGAGLYHSMDYRIKPWISREKIVGTAVTVDVPTGEGAMVAQAIHSLTPGDILVVAGRGNCDCSYWGDHRSLCARMTGAVGVVIDGAYRDHEGCQEIGFPIYAKALTCGTAGKSGAGAINVPVSCGGVTVNPGDIVVGDVNGVCVFPPERAREIMEKALAKRKAQEAVIAQMKRTGTIMTKIKIK
jgi:regulator of RNase E activity RraA